MAALQCYFFATQKARFILHDTTHLLAADSDVCPTCGQVIQPLPAYGSRTSTTRKVALGVSVLLHVLLAAYVLLRSDKIEKIPPPKKESAMVYIAPLKDKPQPKPQLLKPQLLKTPGDTLPSLLVNHSRLVSQQPLPVLTQCTARTC